MPADRIQPSPSSADRLDEHLTVYPQLRDRILRQLLVALHDRGIVSIDQVYEEARHAEGGERSGWSDKLNANVAEAPRGDLAERERVNDLTKRYVAGHLSVREIDEIVNLTLKREEADDLRAIASLSSVSFRILAEKVRKFCALPEGEMQLTPDEAIGIRVGLIRQFLSDQLEFIALAKRYLRIRDFYEIIGRIIGPEAGMGRIGGKASGMLVAYKILTASPIASEPEGATPDFVGRGAPSRPEPAAPRAALRFESSLPGGEIPVVIPESYYLRSDVIEDFIAFNRLGEYQNQKYKTAEEIRREYPLIKSVFRNAEFPAGVTERLRTVLDHLGPHPLIVRSSSLLEDRLGTSFSGKYLSIFVANQGDIEKRLRSLLGAIAEVYASALGPDPLLYRREHQLSDYAEDMAVLIQKVVGRRFGPYFAPAFAGVSFSRNEYRWSPRIKREDGLMRIVMGLGTRAVDRIGSEFPRMVALGMPTLRPESTPLEIIRHAQRTIDVINLPRNRLESITLDTVSQYAGEFPNLDKIVSIRREGMLYAPTGTYIEADPADLFITFDKLLAEGTYPARMKQILTRLEAAYGLPVDVEFADDGEKLYILQCRTQAQGKFIGQVSIPKGIEDARTIFSARKFVRSGVVEGVEYIVYVDPRDYERVPAREERIAVARAIGRLNELLADRVFILIGPGRWGSNDVRLGVPVSYADINKTKMLIEVARERDGYVPEVSFGTHFFQDLIEAEIAYLPLYPDDRRNRFNETFLGGSPNSLPELLPEAARLAHVIRVIHVPSVARGRRLRVVMDGNQDHALAYLEDA